MGEADRQLDRRSVRVPLRRRRAAGPLAALWTIVLVIDFAISFSYVLWPRGDFEHTDG